MSAKRDGQAMDETVKAIEAGDRVALARAITLVESAKPEDTVRAQALLERLLPRTGNATRVGISGVPGAGKSTLIDQLGLNLVASGKKVAVLAVDPTSTRSGGSILGDKTRMGRLATETSAFIRPSPAGDSLGGVTKTTRETIALLEAAGYDVVLVETVGSGQSETAVSNMVDIFVVVGIPGAGDELQGIKRGLLELADIIAVNKADGDQIERANRAAMEYRTGLHILAAGNPNWSPVVLTVSARDNAGLEELWTKIEERFAALKASGALGERRAEQAVAWMREIFDQRLLAAFKGGKEVGRRWREMEEKVRAGAMTPSAAAAELGRLAGVSLGKSDQS
jgi:LAO/AO transport system kinase